MPEKAILVYDVGGSHVAAAICHADSYQLGPVITASHPAEQTSDAFIHLLHSLGTEASNGANNVSGAGLAVPGPFDLEAGISRMRHKLPFLFGINLRQALAERFGWQPAQVTFLNDAEAFLLGEMTAGAARGVARAVGITLGTGFGSAFAVDGRVVTEGPGVPPGGEMWNLSFKDGILEDYVSSRAIQNYYKRRTGAMRRVAELAASVADDSAACEAFVEFGHQFGRALRCFLTAFAPDVVVLGGGISRSARLFVPAAERELQGLNFAMLISAGLEHTALVGAAVAWSHNLTTPQKMPC